MVITVCIGSSCHLKGSREIISIIECAIAKNNISDKVILKGSFCLGQCMNGVCVDLDGTLHSVSPATAIDFFHKEVLSWFCP